MDGRAQDREPQEPEGLGGPEAEPNGGKPRARRRLGLPARFALPRLRLLIPVLLAAGVGAWLLLSAGEEESAAPEPEGAVSTEIKGLVAGLSPEEQVDQVLMLGFEGTSVDGEIADELAEHQLGAVLIGAENWPGAAAGAKLIDRIEAAGRAGGRLAPLVATTQEGGPYRALADLPPELSQLEIADQASLQAAEQWASAGAEALAGVGIDLNLFPIADVATLDSALADRAFSDDPALAAELAAAAIRGCEEAGIACAPLHFPGLGASSQDPSAGPATVGLDPAALEERDLEPFRAAFAAGSPAVVLSLAIYSAYDPVTPAALAEPIASGLLREELGFEGVAITDDLTAGAIRAGTRVPRAAVMALAAGADLVQISSPDAQRGVREAIIAAAETGELDPARLAEAAGRVLELKRELGFEGLPQRPGER